MTIRQCFAAANDNEVSDNEVLNFLFRYHCAECDVTNSVRVIPVPTGFAAILDGITFGYWDDKAVRCYMISPETTGNTPDDARYKLARYLYDKGETLEIISFTRAYPHPTNGTHLKTTC